jgi:outer membrane phospholipase A
MTVKPILLMIALTALTHGPARAGVPSDLPGPRPTNHALGDPAEQEFKLQVSLSLWVLATQTAQSGLYGAYQQRSLWSIDDSPRPFRMENDYRPEVGGALGPDVGRRVVGSWPDWLTLSGAYIHESNGLEGDLSRSWNRFAGTFHFAPPGSAWRGSLSLWAAFRVEATTDGITDHAGDGELRLVWDLPGRLSGSTARFRTAFSPGAPNDAFFTNFEAGLYLWPTFLPRWMLPGEGGPNVDLLIEAFFGSGEFLYDFAEPTNRIRFGLSLRL